VENALIREEQGEPKKARLPLPREGKGYLCQNLMEGECGEGVVK
jgi:hypothetical protein